MRRFFLLICLLAAGCADTVILVDAPPDVQAGSFRGMRSVSEAEASFYRARTQIEPVAENFCAQQNPDFPPIACDFTFNLVDDPRLGPNAYQTVNRNGQPQVVFTLALLRQLDNDDEVAFILGHEASHQIARHILKTAAQERIGAALLGGLVAASGNATSASVDRAAGLGALIGSRAYSKRFELEADVLATYIVDAAGYDPIVGAAPFTRIETGSSAFLATHPPSADRLGLVREVAAQIASDRARGRTPRPPKF